MKKLVIASRNEGKIREISQMLSKSRISDQFELLGLNDIPGLPADFDVAEPCSTYEANAVIKAVEYGKKINMLVLADDSGLEVEALDGRPGVFSARYGPSEWSGKREQLLSELSEVSDKDRGAQFVCTMAIYNPENLKLKTCQGILKGKIAREATGHNGFGFDPIFFSEKFSKTLAELKPEEKNSISHRFFCLTEAYKILAKEFI